MADIDHLARNVVAHFCADCKCVGVDSLRRDGSSSSEASVGTATSLLLPERSGGGGGVAGSEQAGGVVLSGGSSRGGARYRGAAAGSSGSAGGVVQVVSATARSPGVGEIELGRQSLNGQVNVNIGIDPGVNVAADADDDDDDVFCAADIVANNLEELNSGKYTKLKLAFHDWERTFERFQKRREYKEAQRDAIRNEIYQVIGFYIVFQGVIFTAVAQASTLRCHNWWTSFLLSLLTSLVTTGVVLQKLKDFWALETTIASEKSSAKVLMTRIDNVKLGIGPRAFNFARDAKDGVNNEGSTKPGFAARLYGIAVITVLLCFSAIFLVSCWRILCEPGIELGAIESCTQGALLVSNHEFH